MCKHNASAQPETGVVDFRALKERLSPYYPDYYGTPLDNAHGELKEVRTARRERKSSQLFAVGPNQRKPDDDRECSAVEDCVRDVHAHRARDSCRETQGERDGAHKTHL